jgi:hypothetical protein
MTLYCFKCHSEVVFDAEHIGKNGKKIPLDPTTRRPHDCPEREQGQPTQSWQKMNVLGDTEPAKNNADKDDHGNESFPPVSSQNYINDHMPKEDKKEYVDHTVKGASKVKIFAGYPSTVQTGYDAFLAENNGKIRTQGAQFQMHDGEFAIALYYEETKQ